MKDWVISLDDKQGRLPYWMIKVFPLVGAVVLIDIPTHPFKIPPAHFE